MTTKTGKRAQGLTAGAVTIGGAAQGLKLTPQADTLLTAVRRPRRYSPRARKCACGCGVAFKPKSKRGRYFSEACRKRDERKRKAKPVKTKPVAPILVSLECCRCGLGFFAEQGKGAKYCSASCKELAYRIRRVSTIEALVGDMNIDEAAAVEMVERIGMRRTGVYLRGRGYHYDEQARRWGVPAGVRVSIEV